MERMGQALNGMDALGSLPDGYMISKLRSHFLFECLKENFTAASSLQDKLESLIAQMSESQRLSYLIAKFDFAVKRDSGGRELIQVCASLDDPETRDQEVRALVEGCAECPEARGVILTLESRMPFPEVPQGIVVMPAWEWILRAFGR
ncbi:MAG: hypothetical protein ACKOLA_11005, partial [Spartobacteria bacterium]